MILNDIHDLSSLRNKYYDKIIVMCHGVFDIFHIGHLHYLKESKKLGDLIFVSVTANEFVNKGIGRPVFDQNERISIIDSLKVVDYCIISNYSDASPIISHLSPNFYVKGSDVFNKQWCASENLFIEKNMIKKCGGKLMFVDMINTHHSTNLIERI